MHLELLDISEAVHLLDDNAFKIISCTCPYLQEVSIALICSNASLGSILETMLVLVMHEFFDLPI